MYRKIEQLLVEWYHKGYKKPLLIKGARQVGKTYAVREFASKNIDNFIEINFEKDSEYRELFERTIKPEDILSYIEVRNLQRNLKVGKTLLFLDEIQSCPQAITALKFLKEESPYAIIASGSMLGVAIHASTSFPVGYVTIQAMYPMDFEEFLLALGMEDKYIQLLKDIAQGVLQPITHLHSVFLEYFKNYLMVGGMPEAVSTFVSTKSYRDTLFVQKQIVMGYTNDMAKYASAENKIKAHECFHSIPLQLAKENKKFQYKLVKEGYNSRYYDASLRWLEESGLMIKVNRLKCIEKPLEAYQELPIFKVYMFDTGLLISQFDDGVIADIYAGNLKVFKGALYENLTAQILKAKEKAMYYFEMNTSSEIDFITYCNGHITPLEIKAGLHTRSKSFTNFVNTYKPKYAYRFSSKEPGIENGIYYLPYYVLPFIM